MVTEFTKRYFSEGDCTQIENQIAEIEKKTSGEIVVALVPTSDSYFRIRLMGALSGGFAATCIALFIEYQGHWGYAFWKLFLIQLFGIFSGITLSYWPVFARILVPKYIRTRNVHREALAQFTALGLHATKEHSGILILLSVFERSVEILADRGIHSKVDAGYWKKHTDKIAEGFSSKQPAAHLAEVLKEIGNKLADHFPPDPLNPNELSNKVRFRG